MENFILGTSTVLLSSLFYWYSWAKYKTQNYQLAIILIVVAGFLLRMYVASDCFLHPWDERYHALVAKNLIAHPFKPTLYEFPIMPYDYKDWAANHIWVHKQPLPLWSMALSLKIFGINEIALRLPSVLISTIAIWLTYGIAQVLFNKKTALIAAFLHSINGLVIELTGGRIATDHSDLFFLFFIELGVYFSILSILKNKKWILIAIGISIGLAILSKWLPALIVLPIWVCFCLKQKLDLLTIGKRLSIIIITCVTIFLPWQIYIYSHFPLEAAWESEYNIKHIFEALGNHSAPFYYHFQKLNVIFGELVLIPLVWSLYVFWKRIGRSDAYKWLALILWILIPVLFFSFVQTKLQAYTIFCAPALFILIAQFFVYAFHFKKKLVKYNKGITVLLTLLILLPIRYSIERIKPFSFRDREPEWKKEIVHFCSGLTNEENVIVFNEKKPIELMFYSSIMAAYHFIPKKKKLDELAIIGYTIFIKDEEGNYLIYE